jgi:large subunit ribosomal protein L25
MKQTTLNVQSRDLKGKGAAGRLRRTGIFPAVIYAEGRPGVNIQVNEHDFVMMLRSHRSDNMILDLAVEGTDKPFKVMLKAMQNHPLNGRVIHVDFYEVSMTRKIEIEITVRLSGTPVGVANEGGVLEHGLRVLNMSCLPGDVLEELVLDISGLHANESLRVSDVAIDTSKYEVLDGPDQVVVAVAIPRAEAAATTADGEPVAEGAEEGASPEVLTEKKDEEGDAAASKDEKKKE